MSTLRSGRVRIALAGGICVAWAVLMFIVFALVVTQEASSVVGAFKSDAFYTLLAISDMALLIVGIGLLTAAVLSRSSVSKAMKALQALYGMLVVYGSVTCAVTIWFASRSERAFGAALIVGILMAVILTVWVLVLREARRFCERLLAT